MFKNKCCGLALLSHKFCGKCGTNLELARKLEREWELKERLRKLLGTCCEVCGFRGQFDSFCTQCGAKMLSSPLENDEENIYKTIPNYFDDLHTILKREF